MSETVCLVPVRKMYRDGLVASACIHCGTSILDGQPRAESRSAANGPWCGHRCVIVNGLTSRKSDVDRKIIA